MRHETCDLKDLKRDLDLPNQAHICMYLFEFELYD
jgi:hypothetical protein